MRKRANEREGSRDKRTREREVREREREQNDYGFAGAAVVGSVGYPIHFQHTKIQLFGGDQLVVGKDPGLGSGPGLGMLD